MNTMRKNMPWTTVAVLGLLIAGIVVLIVTGHSNDNTLITVLAGLIPGLLAAGYAERTSRDVRNGVVEEKAKQGAKQALDETGLTEVASESAATTKSFVDTMNAHTAALTQLVEKALVTDPPKKDGA